MGRRTGWWRSAVAMGAVLCAVAVTPGLAAAADSPPPYDFAENAVTVEGAVTTADAERLTPGKPYRGSIRPGEKLYYRLELDAATNAYVAATTVPEPGSEVSATEGVTVTVQDADGHQCSFDTVRFGSLRSPRPVTAWAGREIGGDPYMCQEGGTYYAVVERLVPASSERDRAGNGSGGGGVWQLDLTHILEPPLKKAGSTTAPETWNPASPEAVTGESRPRAGGAGFATASAVGQGVWEAKGGIRAGQTLYYRIPVDWGRRLHVTAELGSAERNGGFLGRALDLSLHNPVRGVVDDVTSPYDGRQRSLGLEPLPPVRYENRYAADDRMSAMRFAGWYYVAIHLTDAVGTRYGTEPLGLILRVRLAGEAKAEPGYLGSASPEGTFEVTDDEVAAAESGSAGGATEDGSRGDTGGAGGAGGSGGTGDAEGSQGTTKASESSGVGEDKAGLRALAAGGIGTGTLLVLFLAVWTLMARRRAGAP